MSTLVTVGVEAVISGLERNRSLEELHRFYEAKDFSKVVDLLLATFTSKRRRRQADAAAAVDRHEQLQLLQESLLQLDEVNRCLLWSEVSFSEAKQFYEASRNDAARADWLKTMLTLLDGIEKLAASQSYFYTNKKQL